MTKVSVRALLFRGSDLLVMERHKGEQHYFTLVGGGIEPGEQPEQALLRELAEETGLVIDGPKLIFTEEVDDVFGQQQIFLCTYVSGEPSLHPESEEKYLTEQGLNRYKPIWLSIDELQNTVFRSETLKTAILEGYKNGWPGEPKNITR